MSAGLHDFQPDDSTVDTVGVVKPQVTLTTEVLTPAEEDEKLPTYESIRPRVSAILSYWKTSIMPQLDAQSEDRRFEIDVAEQRREGNLDADEIMVPIRTISQNVETAKAGFVELLGGESGALVSLHSDHFLEEPDKIVYLQKLINREIKSRGWLKTHVRVIDSFCTHGFSHYELIVDNDAPLGWRIADIPARTLLFPEAVNSIADADIVIRRKTILPSRLQALAKIDSMEFEPDAVAEILLQHTISEKSDDVDTTKRLNASILSDTTLDSMRIEYLKIYFRNPDDDNALYQGLAWENGSLWLRKPQKLMSGKLRDTTKPDSDVKFVEEPARRMPFYESILIEDESDVLTEKRGRAQLDKPTQEANTVLASAFANGAQRSSNIHASPANPQFEGEASLTNKKVMNGVAWDSPMNFHQQQPPSDSLLLGMRQFTAENNKDAGNITFSTLDRAKSNTTAQELRTSQGVSDSLSTISKLGFINTLRSMFADALAITFSRILFGELEIPSMKPDFPIKEIVAKPIFVGSAASEDVIERNRILGNIVQILPLLQAGSKYSDVLIELMIRLMFPARAAEIIGDADKNEQTQEAMKQLLEPAKRMAELILQYVNSNGQLDALKTAELAELAKSFIETNV